MSLCQISCWTNTQCFGCFLHKLQNVLYYCTVLNSASVPTKTINVLYRTLRLACEENNYCASLSLGPDNCCGTKEHDATHCTARCFKKTHKTDGQQSQASLARQAARVAPNKHFGDDLFFCKLVALYATVDSSKRAVCLEGYSWLCTLVQ